MYGAVFGDIVGSVYEFDRGEKTKLFRLFTEESDYTDDTVMTLAVAEALIEAGPKADTDKISSECAKWMRELGNRYTGRGYGGRFAQWLSDPAMGPYNSFGNGSGMRVSPAGWFYDTIERTREVARATALPTHDHPEGIKGAEAVASVIFFARNGWTKDMIRAYIKREFGYNLDRTLDEIRPTYHMDETCQGSVPEAIIAFLEAEDFEDAIRGAVSIGGDTDTTACMAGSMAEAYFGFPDEFREEVTDRLPDELMQILAKTEQLRNGLKERNDIPTAIGIFNKSEGVKDIGKVINSVAVRIKAGGLFYVPVEIKDREVTEFTLLKGPDDGANIVRRSIVTKDGKRWAVAFSSEEELMKKADPPTAYIAEPAGFTVALSQKLPECSGLALNVWGEKFFMSLEMIERFIIKSRENDVKNT